ncbi:uncharacterized protein T15H9.5-like isoform X2 [Macadamia integrifolia]|uniref:uncharacterized protein T15H9.5-like isoform X2 n=1 Tax=Macadamia integrifolia TaxID=60698 RepID=UPI001C4FF390|nr:uncharacterized protein T15H9.5-like isoform X2 [Macadamia integrifolia]
MASETLEDKKPDEDVPDEEKAVVAEGDEEKGVSKTVDEDLLAEEKAVAAEGDEEKGNSETVEKDVSEEEKVKEVEAEQEDVGEEKQADEEEKPTEKVKASRKRSSKKGGGEELKKLGEESTQKQPRKRNSISKEPVTPVDRPARERKSVERYSALSSEKVSATKGLSIEKGRGTQLKDIPNDC